MQLLVTRKQRIGVLVKAPFDQREHFAAVRVLLRVATPSCGDASHARDSQCSLDEKQCLLHTLDRALSVARHRRKRCGRLRRLGDDSAVTSAGIDFEEE